MQGVRDGLEPEPVRSSHHDRLRLDDLSEEIEPSRLGPHLAPSAVPLDGGVVGRLQRGLLVGRPVDDLGPAARIEAVPHRGHVVEPPLDHDRFGRLGQLVGGEALEAPQAVSSMWPHPTMNTRGCPPLSGIAEKSSSKPLTVSKST